MPLDTLAVARLLAASPCPGGLLFFDNKTVPHAYGPLRSKLSSVNTNSVLDALVNETVATDPRGIARPDWGLVIKPGIGRSLVAGDFKLGGPQALHLYRLLLEKLLQRRHGNLCTRARGTIL